MADTGSIHTLFTWKTCYYALFLYALFQSEINTPQIIYPSLKHWITHTRQKISKYTILHIMWQIMLYISRLVVTT